MKVRKLAVALALVGGLGSGLAQALGLGEVELQSYLNEPLDADITLRNTGQVRAEEVYVKLAPPEVFKRVGVDRDFFLTNLKFDVKTSPDGRLVVSITSRKAVREPYLDFLIEVSWPSGKLLREYSLLLDPPVYAEQNNSEQGVQPAQTAASSPSSGSTDGQGASDTRQTRASASQSSGNQTTSAAGGGQQTFGPTDASDTLWGIALKVRPGSGYSPQQVMLALQDLNPKAFMNGNINRLKRGQVLRIPTADQISRRSTSQAITEVTAQNNALKKQQAPVDATDQQTASAGSQQASESGDELRLLAADDKATSAEDGASAGGEDGVAGGARNAGNTIASAEELDKAERENNELNSRVDDLESQVETLQRLIELKNSQLAEMQNQSGGDTQDSTVSGGQSDAAAPETETANGSEVASSNGDDLAMAGDAGPDEQPGANAGEMSSGTDTADAEPDQSASQAGGEMLAANNMAQASDTNAAGEQTTGSNATGDDAGNMNDDALSAGNQDAMTAGNAAQEDSAGNSADSMAADNMTADNMTADSMNGDSMNGEGAGAANDVGASDEVTDAGAMSGSGESGEPDQNQQAEDMAAGNGDETGSTQEGVTSLETGGTNGSADAGESQTSEMAGSVSDQSGQPEQGRGLVEGLVHGLKTNPIYQILAGGAAVLLLLLLGLLARRNAKREKDFYDELNREGHEDSESFSLDFGDDGDESSVADEPEERDVIPEADAYLAYGRHDQAAEVLENGISQEPSRSDLRVKLLSVYAEAGNRDAFEKQYRELETLDDESALAEAQGLHGRLDESESTPSIDELESQLRSGSDAEATSDTDQSAWGDESLSAGFTDYRDDHESTESESTETAEDSRPDEAEDDLGDAFAELENEQTETAGELPGSDDSGHAEDHGNDKDSPIEYDLSGVLSEEQEEPAAETEAPQDVSGELASMDELTAEDDPALDSELTASRDNAIDEDSGTDADELTEDDFGSLELDDQVAERDGESDADGSDRATSDDEQPVINEDPELAEEEPGLATDEHGKIDESFLDDLDAELDKVAGEEPEDTRALDEDNLEELELDVSDEDLALMEEVSEKPDSAQPEAPDADEGEADRTLDASGSLEESLDLEDEADEIGAGQIDEAAERDPDQEPATLRPETYHSGVTPEDIDEDALDDEDDFDFLAGTDEAATKLDLARAYVEMGDADGARDILEEVSIEGSGGQKSEAQQMLKNLS